MSLGMRAVMVLGLAGVILFALVVDFGVSAGRIHHGVRLGTLDLGGLTEKEAAGLLAHRVHVLRDAPVVFSAEGITSVLHPAAVGWRPKADRTAAAAMRVGRSRGVLGALGDRWRAWFGGVRIDWFGQSNPDKVGSFIDAVQARAERRGFILDRAKLRYKIKRGISLWPRKPLRIPLTKA